VKINLGNLKKFDHLGIKIQLIGKIDNVIESAKSVTFLKSTRELEPAG